MTTNEELYEKELKAYVDAHLEKGVRFASEEEILYHIKSAQQHLSWKTKNKQISFRIPERDLIKLKAKALEKWIPYQTYLSSLIHEHIQS